MLGLCHGEKRWAQANLFDKANEQSQARLSSVTARKGGLAGTFFMLLRSCILLVPIFLLLPPLVGNDGLWLAVPLSEMLTTVCLLAALGMRRHPAGKSLAG